MTLVLPQLTEVNPDTVEAFFSLASTQIEEDNAALDARRGALGEILVYYHALLASQIDDAIETLHASRSLLAINEDPAGAPEGAVDDVLSNFRVTRLAATIGTGVVTVVVDGNTPVLIPAGSVFTAGTREFTVEATYTAKPSGAQITSDTDVLFRSVGNGQYAFDVPVIAAVSGSGTAVRRGVLVVPEVLPPGYVTSYAAADFTDGADSETNESMLRRLQEGAAAKTPSNRVCLRAMLRDNANFERVVRTSAIGFGDPEMGRDRYSILPVSLGGRVDLYVRSQEAVDHTLASVTATRVGTSDGAAVMQFALGKNDYPGFYEVASVRPADGATDTGSFDILSDTRSLDLTGDNVPDVQGITHGAYSRFQAAVIQFADPTASAPAMGATADYVAEVVGLPLIAELHDYVTDAAREDLRADLLVRAPVPVFVQISLTIEKPPGADSVSDSLIQSAAAGVVNAVDFTGKLYASAVADAVYAVLPGDFRVFGIDMIGRCRYPSGTVEHMRDGEVLTVPDASSVCVSSRTTQFFCRPDDVLVAVVTREATAD